MSTSDITITNTYWEMLRFLSNDVKLRLATLLTSSVAQSYETERITSDVEAKAKNMSKTEYVLSQIAGQWEDSRSVEEMVKDIYDTRKSNSIDDYRNPFDV